MTIREIIEAELDKMDDDYPAELYEIIQQFSQSRQPAKSQPYCTSCGRSRLMGHWIS